MKVITNQKLIKRYNRLGKYLTIISLFVLGGGLVASFTPNYITWAFFALIAGFILSQLGIYFGSRWGRSPRPDERLTNALKGLADNYVLYHYVTDVAHLLIGPAGNWVLLPYPQAGVITYDEKKNRWKQKGGNLYMKIFAQEGLGRPDQDINAALKDARNYLVRATEGQEKPIQAVLVFTNPKAQVEAENAPFPAVSAEKLKDFIRRKAKENPASAEELKVLQKMLPGEDIEG